MQDLNNMPVTQEEEEAMDALAKLGGGVTLGEMFQSMHPSITNRLGETIMLPPNLTVPAVENMPQHAPEPQPSGENPHNPDLPTIINNICTQLQLLATVIKGNSQAEDQSNQSLQECVSLTLQQADWFKDLVRHELIAAGIEDLAKEAVESVVEEEVESYFDHRFDPENHFDFNDAVENAVDDRLDDIVRDRVMDSLDEVVAEKLSEATIKVEF
jgi:hypothetical protein